MALIASYGFQPLRRRFTPLPSRIISGAAAELFMILGYFVFEGFLYGFIPSMVNIPANGVQGVAGLVISIALINSFEKSKITLE